MKKVLAITALTGLIAVGCAHRDKDNDYNSTSHRGGSYDESISTTGSGKDMRQDNSTWNSSTNLNSSSSSSSSSTLDNGASNNSDASKSSSPQK